MTRTPAQTAALRAMLASITDMLTTDRVSDYPDGVLAREFFAYMGTDVPDDLADLVNDANDADARAAARDFGEFDRSRRMDGRVAA